MKNQSPKPLRTERHGRLLLRLLPSVIGCNARKRSRIRCTKAAVHWLCAAALPVPSNPMVAAFACCARAAARATKAELLLVGSKIEAH